MRSQDLHAPGLEGNIYNLDHSCNKYCKLIGQEEVNNSDRIPT